MLFRTPLILFVRNYFFYYFFRIEILWRDIYKAVTNVFYSVLHTLEEGNLDPFNELHLFCCHYVFIPRLQASIVVFCDGWDDHPLKSEQYLSQNQLWEMGQMQCPDPDVSSVHSGNPGGTVKAVLHRGLSPKPR